MLDHNSICYCINHPSWRSYKLFQCGCGFLAVALTLHAPHLRAQNNPTTQQEMTIEKLRALSLDDLMKLEIYSVAKKKQSLATSASAIHVITADDIRRSGVTTIAEAAAKPKAPVKTIEESTPAASTAPLKNFSIEDWHAVPGAIKKHNAPLFSVVKQAQPEFDSAKQTLTLIFKFQLHRKKLDDPKQKAAIVSIMNATLGGAPSIATDVNINATPPPAPPADPKIASVAAIMGGGELIDPAT